MRDAGGLELLEGPLRDDAPLVEEDAVGQRQVLRLVVTRVRVVPASSPPGPITRRKMCLPTCASTAEVVQNTVGARA